MRRLPRLLAAVVVLSLVPTVAGAETDLEERLDETQAERERTEAEIAELSRQEGDARERLSLAETALADAEAELVELGEALEAATAELAAAERRMRDARDRLMEVDDLLVEAEAELATKRDRLEHRVRSAYKHGHASFAEMFVALSGSEDITEFVSSSTYLAHVMNDDKELLEEVHALVLAIDARRTEANDLRREAEEEAAAAAAATAEVEWATEEQERLTEVVREQREERESALEALREDRAAMEGHLAGLDEESQRIEDQLAEIARQQAEEQRRAEEAAARAAAEEAERQAAAAAAAAAEAEAAAAAEAEAAEAEERAARSAPDPCATPGADGCDEPAATSPPTPAPSPSPSPSPPASPPAPSPPPPPETSGSWVRPVGGHMTSPFGPRWGRNHNGVDLAGSVGTGVVASQAGVVVHVTNSCHATSSWGCGGGFGNYVTISHPGGMATIYAHLANVSIGSGQQVNAGQSIGTVGNSGNSYGPHLHFETREAGTPRNPCNYIAC